MWGPAEPFKPGPQTRSLSTARGEGDASAPSGGRCVFRHPQQPGTTGAWGCPLELCSATRGPICSSPHLQRNPVTIPCNKHDPLRTLTGFSRDSLQIGLLKIGLHATGVCFLRASAPERKRRAGSAGAGPPTRRASSAGRGKAGRGDDERDRGSFILHASPLS